MSTPHTRVYNPLRIVVILGNIFFAFWLTYNGINEGLQGTTVQIVSYVGLLLLLGANAFLIHRTKA